MGHTPGPWHCHVHTAVAEESDGEYGTATCITTVGEEEYTRVGHRGDLLAWVPHDRRHEENARLIAAAPDLLAALKEAYDALDYAQAQVDSETDRMYLTRHRRKIKPVIDNAEGRSE